MVSGCTHPKKLGAIRTSFVESVVQVKESLADTNSTAVRELFSFLGGATYRPMQQRAVLFASVQAERLSQEASVTPSVTATGPLLDAECV